MQYRHCIRCEHYLCDCSAFRFANIVANSTVIMKRFKLKLTKAFWRSQNELLDLRRKHLTIEMVDVPVNCHSALCKVFEKFGPFLRSLFICNCTLDDFTLLTILKCSSILEQLFMSEVEIIQQLPLINPKSMVRLTSVSIHHTNWLIFNFLSKSQLTYLLVNNYLDEGEGTRTHLVSMLSEQNRLRELILKGTSWRTLFRDRDFNGMRKNHLNKLHISSVFGKNSDDVDKYITEFLAMNNDSLRSVEISIPNCERITNVIISNLNDITSLTLNIGNLPKDISFYEQLVATGPNRQLKHLKLSGFFNRQTEFVKDILAHYPVIVNLELDDWSDTISTSNTLKFVAENLSQLEQLFIPAISETTGELKFRALQQLHVGCVSDMDNLIRFAQQNSSLAALKIGLVYIEQEQSIFKLMDQTQVHHLTLAGSAKTLQMIFDVVRVKPSRTLKTLELSLISHENYSRHSNVLRKSIQINFTNNLPDLLHAKVKDFLDDGTSRWLSGF